MENIRRFPKVQKKFKRLCVIFSFIHIKSIIFKPIFTLVFVNLCLNLWDILRSFQNGTKFGIFASFTDVSSEQFGEGSFDKGIYINIPLDWLTGTPSMSKRNFTIRPITRDGGARLATARQLYKMVRDAREKQLAREIGRMWKWRDCSAFYLLCLPYLPVIIL